MTEQSARVAVLTAEVRTLMVGNRQVTLSVYRQLDVVEPDEIEPFGRVCDSKDAAVRCLVNTRGVYDGETPCGRDGVHVVGRGETGALVRSSAWTRRVRPGAPDYPLDSCYGSERRRWREEWIERDPYHAEWSWLPLIILAGLR